MGLKCVSVFAIFLLCLSLIGSSFAINSNLNVLTYNNVMCDEFPDDVIDYNGFTPTSKIAHEATFNLDPSISYYPPNMRTFADLIVFFKANNIPATAEHVNKDALRPGDIVQLKNSDSAFLVYMGESFTDKNKIILEDLYDQFECSVESFDLLFTGNAIIINHSTTRSCNIHAKVPELTTIDTRKINDNPIYGPNTRAGIILFGASSYRNAVNSWENAQNDPRIKKIAAQLKTSKSDYQNLKNIYNWMDDNVKYHFHYNTRDTLTYTWAERNGKAGYHKYANCCEQARIMVAIARAMGINAKFIQVPGHVFSKEYANDKSRYVVIDTCYQSQYRFDKPSIVTNEAQITDNLGF